MELPLQMLDFLDEIRQVGLGERKVGRGQAMMFDVRRNVFVVRMGGRQGRIVWVGLRIVPVQLLAAAPDLVTIAFQNQRPGVKSQAFLDNQAIALKETALAGYSDHARATTSHYQRRGYNRRKLLRQAVDKFFVITQRLEGVHGAPPVRSL